MIVKYKKCFIAIIILLSVCDCESKRGVGGRRGGYTTPRTRYTTHHSNNNNYHTTQSSIGFENYQRTQNNGNIGFENAQNRPPLNNQPHTSNTNPSAPQQPNQYNPQQPPSSIGFENVQNRLPQNNPPYHQNHNNQGPPPPYQNQHPNYNYGHQQQTPPGYNQYPNNPQYNPYQPPPNYYTPHYGSPGGIPPPIYQPVQQSSGSSILGYAGALGGGYLIGRLTSGGFGSNNGGGGGSGDYTVHHYHHNANDVPKQVSVAANGLVSCPQNQTQGLCVPNTFPFCLSNGTILCVTHLSFTTPCNTNNSMPCVISVLPCASNDSSCNETTSMNGTINAVYIPCISKVTVAQQTVLNFTSDNGTNQSGSITNVDYCITAIAEPKVLPSAVPSYFDFLKQLVMSTLNVTSANNMTNSTMDMTNFAPFKTEMTTLLPVANN